MVEDLDSSFEMGTVDNASIEFKSILYDYNGNRWVFLIEFTYLNVSFSFNCDKQRRAVTLSHKFYSLEHEIKIIKEAYYAFSLLVGDEKSVES